MVSSITSTRKGGIDSRFNIFMFVDIAILLRWSQCILFRVQVCPVFGCSIIIDYPLSRSPIFGSGVMIANWQFFTAALRSQALYAFASKVFFIYIQVL